MVLAALATLMLALEAYRHFRPPHPGVMPQPFGLAFAALLVLFWTLRGPRSERAGRIAATLMLSLPFNRRLLPERLATLLVVGSAVYTVWFWTRIETDRAMVRRAWLSAVVVLAAFCLVWTWTGW
jgi:hypothetical protein